MTTGQREAAYALGAYGAYLAVRRLVWNERGRERARHNARHVVAAEQRLHIDVERRVQQSALRVPRLVDVLNAGYAVGNVALSVGWLMRLYRSGNDDYRRERDAAMIAFLGALPVFAAFPTAPPRVLDDFVDTLAQQGWNLDHPHLVRFYNPIAAMPSHHVAFAVVTGFGLARHAHGPLGRTLGRAHAGAVTAIVVATGNHFVSDVVAGALLGALARRLAREMVR